MNTETEVEISRGFLIGILVAIGLVLLLIIGTVSSPRDAEGRPLLLSPERRAVLRFLHSANGWSDELLDILAVLDRLAEEVRMAPAPEDLYNRAREAQNTLERARMLETMIRRTRTPDTMIGLRDLALQAAEATRAYAEAVSARVGVPEGGEIAGRSEAHTAAEKFREALRATRTIP